MVVPVIFLLLGVLCGRFFLASETLSYIDIWIMASLCVMVFSAGVDVGSKKLIFSKLAQYHAKILLIPLGTVIGTLAGGIILGVILKIPVNEAAAVSAGFGYYSLSAGILTNMGGAGLGALAFISNIFRELISFLIIPPIAKYLNPYCAIAPGGATSMDTTLCVVSRCTDEEITVMSMINGVILSALVPLLVPFLYRI